MNIYEQIGKNKAQTWLMLALFVLFFAFLGLGMDYFYGAGPQAPVFTAVAVFFALCSIAAAYWSGDKLVLSSTRAMPLDLSDPKERQWQNVIDEMSIAAGIPCPRTYVIADPDPNAFATGRNPEHASIVVTRGLLDTLSRDELQAVASHEMSHIRNYDIRLMLMIAVLVGSVALISDWTARGLFRGKVQGAGGLPPRKRGKEGGGALILLVIWLAAVVLAPMLSQLMAMFVSRRREYLADASGAELTRNPAALASALAKIESKVEPTRSINQGTAHLCICDPKGQRMGLKEGRTADLFATHPPIQKRIEALKDMAYLSGRPSGI